MPKTLIAYYSRKGQNYKDGKTVVLEVGNTERAALMITKATGGDIFEIRAKAPYPEDYDQLTAAAKKERDEDARPELDASLKSLSVYETIFLGYPNWWGTMPMAVYTFLESADFSGKTIIPFATHEGSGLGSSVSEIAKLCPKALIRDEKAFWGSFVQKNEAEILAWVRKASQTQAAAHT